MPVFKSTSGSEACDRAVTQCLTKSDKDRVAHIEDQSLQIYILDEQ